MNKIRALREKIGMKQRQLAELIGADSNLVSRWELGKSSPDKSYIAKLAKALNTTADYLLSDSDDENNGIDVASDNASPYTKEEQKLNTNTGMLVYTFKNGEKVEMPPTRESYDFLEKMISRVAKVAVL